MPGPQFSTFLIRRDDGIKPPMLTMKMFPPSISDVITVTWEGISVMGAADVIKMYDHTGSRTITLPLQFYASVNQGENQGFLFELARQAAPVIASVSAAFVEVVDKVRWIQSLCYPKERELKGPLNHPPIVTLMIGGGVGGPKVAPVNIKCVVMSVSVEWKAPWTGIRAQLAAPQYAEVNVTVETFRDLITTTPDARRDAQRTEAKLITAADVREGRAWQTGGSSTPTSK